jgi:hypothetical protein
MTIPIIAPRPRGASDEDEALEDEEAVEVGVEVLVGLEATRSLAVR